MTTKKTRSRQPRDRSAGWTLAEAQRQKEIGLARARLLDAATRAGEVVEVAAVKEAWVRIMITVRNMVLRLPGQIAFTIPGLTATDKATIEQICRDALEDTAMQRGHEPASRKRALHG
jgi:phage terminase Nu1 subunit (DNA packaging protein)